MQDEDKGNESKSGLSRYIVELPSTVQVSQISAGSRHTLALTTNGEVYSWGWGVLGQLGLGHKKTVLLPTKIDSFSTPVRAISAGGIHSCAIDIHNRCYSWGASQYGQLGLGEFAVRETMRTVPEIIRHSHSQEPFLVHMVSCGGLHTAAIDVHASVWCWGRADSGQIGSSEWVFNFFPGVMCPQKLEGIENAIDVSCGGFHTVVVTADDHVYAMGKDDYGLLGTNGVGEHYNTRYAKPTPIKAISSKSVLGVNCGGWHTLFWTKDGAVYSCGKGEYGRLGQGHEQSRGEPTRIPLDNVRIVHASAGGSHSLLLDAEGKLYSVGRTDGGRLGLEGMTGDRVLHPSMINVAQFGAGSKVVHACAGGAHSMVLLQVDE